MSGNRSGSSASREQFGRTIVRRSMVVALGALTVGIVLAVVACSPPPPTGGTGGTTTTDPGATVPCPSSVDFPDLSASAGGGASYAKPAVSVRCSATRLDVTSNGMISYPFVAKTPNPLKVQNWYWSVPVDPTLAAAPTPVSNKFGTVGFTVTGLPIYAAMEGAQPANEAYGDPMYNGILDTCGGHTGPAGEYHDHAITDSAACGFGTQQILGYALDGIPIMSPDGCLDLACTEPATFTSGWVRTGNPTTNAWTAYTYQASSDPTVLDQCNGRVGPDGVYRYYATATFPYTIGCFAGTEVTQSGEAAVSMANMPGM